MTCYEVLSRHGSGAALKVAALAILALLLSLAAFPLALVTLLLDRAIKALNKAAAKIPVAPVTLVHVAGGAT